MSCAAGDEIEYLHDEAVAHERGALGERLGSGIAGRLQQQVGEARDLEHGAHLRRGGGDHQSSLDRGQPVVRLDEHPDARGAEEPDARQVQAKVVMSLADGLGELGVEALGPRSVEASLDDQLEPSVAGLASDLHLFPHDLVGPLDDGRRGSPGWPRARR